MGDPRDLITQTIVMVGQRLREATNLGQTGDWHDVYFLIDFLTYAVQKAYDAFPCKAGCSACCHEYGMPAVSPLEWTAIEAAVAAMPEEQKGRLKARLEARYRPMLGELQAAAMPAKAMTEASTEGLGEAFPALIGSLPCPLLEDHQCTIYEARPAICRAYGYFTLRRADQLTLFTCKWAVGIIQQTMEGKGLDPFPLPAWNKFAARIAELNDAEGQTKYMPQWLLELFDAAEQAA